MENKSDLEILVDVYKRFLGLAKGKRLNANQRKPKMNELAHQADRSLLFFNSPSTTTAEKEKLLRKAKQTYQQYAILLAGNPECNTGILKCKMEALIDQMARHEAEQAAYFRKRTTGGERINLEQIFENEANVKSLSSSSLESILKNELKDRKVSVVSKTDQKVYITKTGEKYHRAGCPFCKRSKLTEVSFLMVQNAGYEPCRCLNDKDKAMDEDSDKAQEQKKNNRKSMTAFIDESVRTFSFGWNDVPCQEHIASYSYIICRGELHSEMQISDKNTICSNVCVANESQDVTYSAVEAIHAVLMKLAFVEKFNGNVTIYTDNMSAVNKWHKAAGGMFIAGLFESVKVCHIPREQNTAADKLCREKLFLPAKKSDLNTLKKLQKQMGQMDELQEELNFVKEYFPDPRRNIPNLVNELRLVTNAIQCNK